MLKTPLYPSVQEDRLLWMKENNGECSVRSAYHLCMQELFDVHHFKEQGAWELIWKLKAPPKVKNFIWRLCRNVLPTRMRIKEKGVNCAPNCVLCDVNEEDNLHLFFCCSSSCNVWNMWESYSKICNILSQETSSAAIIFQALQTLCAEDATEFCCIMWSIWKQRNNKVWNDVTDVQPFVLARAKSQLFYWRAAKLLTQPPSILQGNLDNLTWKKSAEARYKCNIDASSSKRLNKVGIGVCIRNDTRSFVLAKTEWISPLREVHLGEALGFLSALEWVHVLNLGPIDSELDAKRVVDSFLSDKHDATEFGNIIQDCRTL